jgi:hypothetical protein
MDLSLIYLAVLVISNFSNFHFWPFSSKILESNPKRTATTTYKIYGSCGQKSPLKKYLVPGTSYKNHVWDIAFHSQRPGKALGTVLSIYCVASGTESLLLN